MVITYYDEEGNPLEKESKRELICYDDFGTPFPNDNDDGDNYQKTNLIYEYEDGERQNYGPVEDRGDPKELHFPVDDLDELDKTLHLQTLVHLENRDRERGFLFSNEDLEEFDWSLLGLYDNGIRAEGINVEDLSIPRMWVKTIFFTLARGWNIPEDREKIQEHIDEEKHGIKNYLELEEPIGFRLYKAWNELEDDEYELICRAVKRMVYAVYRRGVIPPKATRERFNIDQVASEIFEGDFDDSENYGVSRSKINVEYKRGELYRFVENLAEKSIDPLTFNRDDSTTWGMSHFIGLFAMSAMIDAGVKNAGKVLKWHHEPNMLSTNDLPIEYIRNRVNSKDGIDVNSRKLPTANEIPPLEDQFEQVHRNFFEIAGDYDFFEEPKTLAIDNVRFGTTTKNISDTISRPPKPTTGVTEEWTFTVASIVDTDSRFTIGAKLITSKDQTPEAANELIEFADEYIDIGMILGDAGMVSRDLIQVFRKWVDEKWILMAPENSKIEDLNEMTPLDRVGYVENMPYIFDDLNKRFNVVAYPKMSSLKKAAGLDPNKKIRHIEHHLETPIKFKSDIFSKEGVAEEIIQRKSEMLQQQISLEEVDEEDTDILVFGDDFNDLGSMKVNEYPTHALFFTDQKLDDIHPTNFYFHYKSRWGIESTFADLKEDFIPPTNSIYPEVRSYLMQIGIVFYNWYIIINRMTSPELELRLNPSPEEVLMAIQEWGITTGKTGGKPGEYQFTDSMKDMGVDK